MSESRRFMLFAILAFLFIATPSINAGWLQEDIAVCTDKAVQQGAAISPDGMGGTIVAWEDARNADVYAQRYDVSGQELWTPNGVDVSNMAGTQKTPRIVADGAGGAFIAFESDTSTGMICTEAKCYSVIVVAKLNPSGTVAWKKRISDGASTSFYVEAKETIPLARTDGHGGAIVAWTTNHELYIDNISCSDPLDCCSWMATNNYAQRIDAAGNLLWGSTPVSVCANDKFPDDLTMAVDSSGATYLVWWDEKPIGNWSAISAQKLDINGNVLWGPNGKTVAPGSSWQSIPAITSGGDGGAVIAWLDNAPAPGGYIYGVHAQRLDSLGGAIWASGATLVSTSSMEITGTAIIPSGPGGSIVVWTEKAGGVTTLFAQRLDAGGKPKWQPNDLMISDGINTCANEHVVPDGERGAVLAWEQIPVEDGLSLRSIWGFSSSDIYSVGDRGMILHYNGTAWSRMASGTAADLSGVWGSAGDNVYAVGKAGLILHYDGLSWSPMASGVAKALTGIWGSSADTIYAVGAANTILRYDGASWSAMDAPNSTGANLWGVHGNGPNNAYAVGTGASYPVGGILLHYYGTSWQCVYCAYGMYYGVWVSPDGCVYASGINYDYLHGFLVRYDGTNWTNTSLPIRCIGHGMWGDRSDNVYAVFDQGYIAHFDGAQWTLSSATTDLLLDVWGTSGDNIWVVGGHYLIRHLENGIWVTQYQASNDVMVQLLDTLGTKMWTESGAPASVNIDAQSAPSVAYGPPGDALLAWSDNRNGNWDIYARKVSISRGPIVATELMSFTAQRIDDGVKVAWQLSQYTEGAPFTVSRADGGQDADWRVIAPAIVRDRLSFSFVDSAVVAGSSYRYRVQVSDERGSRALFETDTIILPPLPLTLHQNFPNPFNPSTTIRYYVPGKCRVRLEVYNVSGRLVARLVDRDQPPGHYDVAWNGRDNLGKQVASGIYFCRLQAGKNVRSRKMVLIR